MKKGLALATLKLIPNSSEKSYLVDWSFVWNRTLREFDSDEKAYL